MTNSTDEVFRAKRKPKNPIKFKISLNEEQKEAKETAQGEEGQEAREDAPS